MARNSKKDVMFLIVTEVVPKKNTSRAIIIHRLTVPSKTDTGGTEMNIPKAL